MGLLPLWGCPTGFLVLLPHPKRLAGARRRPSQFAMVVALLMGGLVAFVGFMRRRPWACSLAPVDLQGRAGAPRSSQWSLGVAAKAASFNSLAHWASASLFPPLAALGSAPRPGAAAPGTPQKNSPYLVSRLLRPLLRAPPPILTRLPRRLRSRRPCGPFFFIAGLASCAFSLPPPWLHPLTKKMARKAAFCRSAPDGPGLHSPPTELRAKEKAPESGGFPLRKKLHLQQLF